MANILHKEKVGLQRRNATATINARQITDRKALGQYPTGMPLSRLLSALAVSRGTKTVIDPMVGHGDLLDSVLERSALLRGRIEHSVGIEIDEDLARVASRRIRVCANEFGGGRASVIAGDAFKITTLERLPHRSYDLVIGNPPYIRYTSLSAEALVGGNQNVDGIREGLAAAVSRLARREEKDAWMSLVNGYAGHVDLTVPAWILSALLVKPGGTLALVVPEAWRTREYANVIRSLMLRFFESVFILEESGRGWFEDAQVRTNLIVATRRNIVSGSTVRGGNEWLLGSGVPVVNLFSSENSNKSLVDCVGASDPDGKFANLVRRKSWDKIAAIPGVSVSFMAHDTIMHEWCDSARGTPWFGKLFGELIIPQSKSRLSGIAIPSPLASLSSIGAKADLCGLKDYSVHIGQGLRTGCNDFFYVEYLGDLEKGAKQKVRVSEALGGAVFSLPQEMLRPAIRRQADLNAEQTSGRVLYLRNWVLPEDLRVAKRFADAYRKNRIQLPRVMPKKFAYYVRGAAKMKVGRSNGAQISDLSAVRTNCRIPKLSDGRPPRFWYMLPDFATRHTPDLFISRVSGASVRIELVDSSDVVVDANFSTLWLEPSVLRPTGLFALLSSIWGKASMEAVGTAMGGGALKLEAAQLRKLPLPILNEQQLLRLNQLGKRLPRDPEALHEVDRIVASAILGVPTEKNAGQSSMVRELNNLKQAMVRRRTRI